MERLYEKWPRVAPYFYYLFPSTAYSATERGRRAHQARHEPAEAVDERRGAGSRPGGTVKNLTIDKNQSGKITGNWGSSHPLLRGDRSSLRSEAPGRLPAPRRTERDHRQANRPRWLALSCLAARLREEMGIGDGYRVRGGAGCDHFGAAFFTNAIEILGGRLGMRQGAVGSLLAAVGTALPESMIAIVAILEPVLTGQASEEGALIGIGAILGAPFMLATLAMFVVGVSALFFRRRRDQGMRLRADAATVSRDVGFFLVFFAVAAGVGLVELPLYLKVAFALVLAFGYGLYVRRTLFSGEHLEEVPKRLLILPRRKDPPHFAVAFQTLASLGVIVAGAHFFVDAVEHAAAGLGLPAGLIALILAPPGDRAPREVQLHLLDKGKARTPLHSATLRAR